MKLHKIILLLILLSGFSIEIPAQNSLQNEIGKLEYDTLKTRSEENDSCRTFSYSFQCGL